MKSPHPDWLLFWTGVGYPTLTFIWMRWGDPISVLLGMTFMGPLLLIPVVVVAKVTGTPFHWTRAGCRFRSVDRGCRLGPDGDVGQNHRRSVRIH